MCLFPGPRESWLSLVLFPLVSDLLGEEWKGQRNSMRIQSVVWAQESRKSKQRTLAFLFLAKNLGEEREAKPLSPGLGGCKVGN